MRTLLPLLTALASATLAFAQDPKPIDVPIWDPARKYRLVGRLHEPFGTVG